MDINNRRARLIDVKETNDRLRITPTLTKKKQSSQAHNQFSLWTGEKNIRKETVTAASQRRAFEESYIFVKEWKRKRLVTEIRLQETTIIPTEFHPVRVIKALSTTFGIKIRCSLWGVQNISNDACPVRIALSNPVSAHSSANGTFIPFSIIRSKGKQDSRQIVRSPKNQ
jgi:hypothetical protein